MVYELTKTNQTELLSNNPNIVFLDFYSPMCGPCQELLPFLNVMDKHFEKDGIDFLKCNVANETVLAQKFKITSVPTTMVIDQDKNIHYVRIGLTDGGSYINEITKIIKKKNKQPGSFTQWLKTLFYGRK